ncbi:reverse transcriptase domain-containing protein [Tanacetum coccineum]
MPRKRTATTTLTTPMTDAQIKALIARGVADALAERDADRSRNGDDSHDSGGDRRRRMPVARECTYTDYLKCQPLNFKGAKGVFGLTQWIEKIEYVFHISNCTVAFQIKFATCTLQGNALTWWNSHVRTVIHDVAYAMPWKTLKKMMTDKYFPRGEIKKLEIKMWNLKSDRVEKYVGGLPDMIHGSVMASKPKTMQDAIKFATELMDQKIHTIAERQTKNKRKFDDNNQTQQQPPRSKIWQGLILLGLVRRSMLGLYHCATSASFTTMAHALQSASDFPELKNQNHRNQARGSEARGMVYALRGGENDQDLNNMEDDINA